MKQMYLFLAILLFAAIPALALDDIEKATTGLVTGVGGFPHFTPQGSSNSGSVQSFRVVARTNTKHNGIYFVPVDSTTYQYSNGRGGLVNVDEPEKDESTLFDQSYTYIFNPSLNLYDNRLLRKQTFGANGSISTLTYSFWHKLSLIWKDSARYVYNYFAGTNKMNGSQLQLSQGGTMWVLHDQSALVYNGNNVVSVNSNSYNATFSYDANNNIVSIENKVFDHTTGQLNNDQHKIYTYDALNLVTSYTLQHWNAGTASWTNTKKWEYTYTNSQVSTSLEYVWNGNSWNLSAKHLFTYHSADHKSSEIVQMWDDNTKLFTNYSKEVWEYNSDGLVTTITASNWNVATGGWENVNGNTQTRFYYEYYSPTSVNTVAQQEYGAINVYPVPASSIANLRIGWQSLTPFTVAIYDITGKVVRQWTEQPVLNYNKELDVSSLSPGDYIIRASGYNEHKSGRIQIVK